MAWFTCRKQSELLLGYGQFPLISVAGEHPKEFCSEGDVTEAVGGESDGAHEDVEETDHVAGVGVEAKMVPQQRFLVDVLPQDQSQGKTIEYQIL